MEDSPPQVPEQGPQQAPKFIKCQKCTTDMPIEDPLMEPQILNGLKISAVVFPTITAKCPTCDAVYVSEIGGVNLIVGWRQISSESRIVLPRMIPPKFK
jgi:hypothetical protein